MFDEPESEASRSTMGNVSTISQDEDKFETDFIDKYPVTSQVDIALLFKFEGTELTAGSRSSDRSKSYSSYSSSCVVIS